MRSLYFKLFVWFWIANGITIGAAIGVLQLSHYLDAAVRHSATPIRPVDIEGAMAVWAQDGEAAFLRHMAALEESSGVEVYWLGERGRQLFDRRIPPNLMELADRYRDHPASLEPTNAPPPGREQAIPVRDVQGHRYIALVQPQGTASPGASWYRNPKAFPIQVGVILLASATGCYILARHLASPVRKLQTVARRLAAGDLTARSDKQVARRRDEVGELAREFDRMADRIAALLNAHKGLLQDVSHELRSPLARLNVALELAAHSAGPAAASPLDRVRLEAERLNTLIGQLLALARLESGVEDVSLSNIDLARLVREVADDADFEARDRGRTVTVSRMDSASVRGNESLLRSALENVLRNAVRLTEELTDVEVSLAVQMYGARHGALISVRDHGPGVPEQALGDIFLPFRRGAGGLSNPAESVGLGLAIAKRAVEANGGSIRAANAPGGGLEVLIELPLPVEKQNPV